MKNTYLILLITLAGLTVNAQDKFVQEEFEVSGVCGMCKNRIESAVIDLSGVRMANWDVDSKLFTVAFQEEKVSLDSIHRVIAGVGHDTPLFKARDEVYSALPDCCLYRIDNMESLMGHIFESDGQGIKQPLMGANVFWEGTTTGATSDEYGGFELPHVHGTSKVVISYVGYSNDTIDVTGKHHLEVDMNPSTILEGVEIFGRKRATEIDYLESLQIQNIGEKELLKAACCNLSESFETTPSVDVSFTDAVTGTRQIQMLGLSGTYTQIMRENLPDTRGLAGIQGLTFTPGTWVENIQLNKGTGSVANGFESISGQINVDLKNPADMERFFVNLYANRMGRLELNTHLQQDVGKNWGTSLLLHGTYNGTKNDVNSDGFLDNPLGTRFIGLNRWEKYSEGLYLQGGVKGTIFSNNGGQLNFDPESDRGSSTVWGNAIDINRVEGWMKIGKISDEKPYQSFGLQLSGSYHQQDSYFGLREYSGEQSFLYANFLFQSIIGNTNHTYRIGSSFMFDDYDENFEGTDYQYRETVPGVFAEYTYNYLDKFSAVVGLRADYHNLFGTFVTPRTFIRYAASENTVLRLTAGRGQRTARIFADNAGLMATSRTWNIQGNDPSNPYGLDPEIAWNYGLNLTQYFNVNYSEGTFSVDYYRTDFTNQVIVDLDDDTQAVSFYNLQGQSFSNSLQAQLDYELFKRFDIRLAYRWLDVRADYQPGLLLKPLVANHRAFANIAYELSNGWAFDITYNRQGAKRIPFTGANPSDYQREEFSPTFGLLSGQVTKNWGAKFSLYLGVENITNFRQNNPIIAADDPFGNYFDSSLVWGPIFGRMIYSGLRYKLMGVENRE